MKKLFVSLMTLALVALPATAGAHQPKPLVKNAAKYCKSLRSELGVETFRQTYGGGDNAFGKCVSQRVHELREARREARKSCSEELGTKSHKFRHDGSNGRGAFHKCVKKVLASETSDDDNEVLNAAKQCKAERALDETAFANKYGTNHNKANAFGKCVSSHSDDEDEPETEPETGDDNGSDDVTKTPSGKRE
jgi:hypothetical protein